MHTVGIIASSPCSVGTEGGDTPVWVLEGAVVDIDLNNDRAWTQDSGLVAISTLLGNDPDADTGWGQTSAYVGANRNSDGLSLSGSEIVAYIGAAKTKLLAGATARLQWKEGSNIEGAGVLNFITSDGSFAVEWDVGLNASDDAQGSSWAGSFNSTIADILSTADGALNCAAYTTTATRGEFSVNGSAADVSVLDTDDWPGTGYDAVLTNLTGGRLQRVTLFDPVASGSLSALSVAA
jgi:hypothetical protein